MSSANDFEMPGPDEPTPRPTSVSDPDAAARVDAPAAQERVEESPNRPQPSSSPWPAIVTAILGVVAAGAIGAAWYLGYGPFEKKAAPSEAEENTAVAAAEPEPTAEPKTEPAVAPPPAEEANQERVTPEELEALTKRLDALQSRLDKAPKSVSAELEPIETRLNPLETLPDAVKTLTNKVKDLEERLLKVETDVEGLKSQVQDLRSTESQTAQLERNVLPEDELERGIRLFQNGRYREAREVFDRLTQSIAPDDARAWYYDALATGLSTGDWSVAAPRLARKGTELEKQGSPTSDKIDEALSNLTESTGRDWITSYRNRIQR